MARTAIGSGGDGGENSPLRQRLFGRAVSRAASLDHGRNLACRSRRNRCPRALRDTILPGGEVLSDTRKVIRYWRLDAAGAC